MSKEAESKTIFEKIIQGEIPSDILFEDEQCIVINDIAPAANIHLLIIPKQKVKNISACKRHHQSLLGHLLLVAGQMAQQRGCADNFKVIINNGEQAGQTVFHLHLHLLSGNIALDKT